MVAQKVSSREMIMKIYSRVPKTRPPAYFFSKKFPKPPRPPILFRPPRLLIFLLCESNSPAIRSKKYLLSKKVIPKASLTILEVNIYV